LGAEWIELEKYVIQFGWGKFDKDSIVPDERIIISHEKFGNGH